MVFVLSAAAPWSEIPVKTFRGPDRESRYPSHQPLTGGIALKQGRLQSRRNKVLRKGSTGESSDSIALQHAGLCTIFQEGFASRLDSEDQTSRQCKSGMVETFPSMCP